MNGDVLIGVVIGFALCALMVGLVWDWCVKAFLEEKKKLWRLEEDEAREARGEPLLPDL